MVVFSFPCAVSELKLYAFFFSILIYFERVSDSVMYGKLQVRIDPGFAGPEVYAVWGWLGALMKKTYLTSANFLKAYEHVAKAPPSLRGGLRGP